jgi:hypothetical protein
MLGANAAAAITAAATNLLLICYPQSEIRTHVGVDNGAVGGALVSKRQKFCFFAPTGQFRFGCAYRIGSIAAVGAPLQETSAGHH